MPGSVLLAPPAPAPPPLAVTGTPLLRLALKPVGAAPGLLDGAWWPHSDSLELELPSLVAELDRRWGRITRVTVHPHDWQPLPRRVPAESHVVRVGWFAGGRDSHKILLLSYGVGRWDLLVVPPRTDQDAAARLMAAATDPARSCAASTLIAAEEVDSAAPSKGTAAGTADEAALEAAWESEGGATGRAFTQVLPDPVHVGSGG